MTIFTALHGLTGSRIMHKHIIYDEMEDRIFHYIHHFRYQALEITANSMFCWDLSTDWYHALCLMQSTFQSTNHIDAPTADALQNLYSCYQEKLDLESLDFVAGSVGEEDQDGRKCFSIALRTRSWTDFANNVCGVNDEDYFRISYSRDADEPPTIDLGFIKYLDTSDLQSLYVDFPGYWDGLKTARELIF
jgi:hypothetical protein